MLTHTLCMTRPLALVAYEKLLPGGQLANKLQDLGYRVLPVSAPEDLQATADREKPLVILIDLEPNAEKTAAAITSVRNAPETAHIPVIAFATVHNEDAHEKARVSGATLVTHDNTIVAHLPQFLEQALQIE
jgi:CheY-like chemotaxis protein